MNTVPVANQVNSALSFVSASILNALNVTNVDEEVAAQIDVARNDIGLFEAMDEWLAHSISKLPSIIEGNVTIRFKNTRDWLQYEEKALSDCLWVAAMKQLQYHSAVNNELLASAFMNWINDNVYQGQEDLGRVTYNRVTVTRDDMMPLAKATISAMIGINTIENTLVKMVIRLQDSSNVTVKAYKMHTVLHEELNSLISELRDTAIMRCKPMSFMPKDWTDSATGVGENAGLKLINKSKLRNKIVAPKVLSAVNKLQRVRFTVATSMLEAAKDMQLNMQLYKGEQFRDMFSDKEVNKESLSLYSELETLRDKEFYFPVTMDKRGRMYYRGGVLSPQGVDFCKAAFQFAEYKALGEHGFKAICIHLANALGFSGQSIKNRVKIIQTEWQKLMFGINTHMDVRKEYPDADVFQALVAIKELQRLAELEGGWSEKTSNLVCHQDGTCNGLQHMAAITGDRPTATAVNCVSSTHEDDPADIYGIIAQAGARLANDDSVRMLMLKYGRDMAKNPVMVTGYGASESTIISNIAKFLAQKGEDVTKAEVIGQAYLQAIEENAGAVTQLTEAIKVRMGFALAAGCKSVTWRTADGFLANTEYTNEEAISIRVGNFFIRKRGMGKQPTDAMKTAQAMAPNFVHSIDATHCRMVVNACDFDLVTVHDSIGSHPCDFFETSSMIRQKYTLVHTCYDALGDLCESINQEKPVFPESNDYKAEEALKSAYIFS